MIRVQPFTSETDISEDPGRCLSLYRYHIAFRTFRLIVVRLECPGARDIGEKRTRVLTEASPFKTELVSSGGLYVLQATYLVPSTWVKSKERPTAARGKHIAEAGKWRFYIYIITMRL